MVVKSQNATTHTVTIGDVDDAPALQYSGTKTSFDENNDDAVPVGSFTATDEDANDADGDITFHKVEDAVGTQPDQFDLTSAGALSVKKDQNPRTTRRSPSTSLPGRVGRTVPR